MKELLMLSRTTKKLITLSAKWKKKDSWIVRSTTLHGRLITDYKAKNLFPRLILALLQKNFLSRKKMTIKSFCKKKKARDVNSKNKWVWTTMMPLTSRRANLRFSNNSDMSVIFILKWTIESPKSGNNSVTSSYFAIVLISEVNHRKLRSQQTYGPLCSRNFPRWKVFCLANYSFPCYGEFAI